MCKNNQTGFTLAEILVIAPVVILAISGFIALIVTMTGQVMMTRGINSLTYDVQDALNRIEEDIKISEQILATNSFTVPVPQGRNGTSTAFENVSHSNGDALILLSHATQKDPHTIDAAPIYYANQPHACDSMSVPSNTPVMVNIVYFVQGNSLWRRLVAPSNYQSASCGNVWQQPSCQAGAPQPHCASDDIRLVEGVEPHLFRVLFFESPGASSNISQARLPSNPSSVRATLIASADTISVEITARGLAAGRDIEYSAETRLATP